ncbi:MAG: hypothetical protein KUG53_00710 [Pseudomonadales bacterium]|nr:hypothetical protein [Pseudomonadales bacterium]
MKALAALLSVAVVVLAVTLGIYFSNGDPIAGEMDPETKKGLLLLKAAEDSCLSGQSNAASLDMSVGLQTHLKAGVDIKKDQAKGAVNYLDEKIRSVSDTKIRDCLQKHMPKISNCLMGDCNAAMLPKEIEFQFTYNSDGNDPNLSDKFIVFAVENRVNNRTLFLQPGHQFFVDSLDLIEEGEKLNLAMYRVVKESHTTVYDKNTSFCLTRAATFKPDSSNHTRFHCHDVSGCKHDIATPAWFDLCTKQSGAYNILPFSFMSQVHAEPAKDTIWFIPTLDTLKSREDMFGIGYTHFTLRSDKALGIDADGFYYEITVNDRKTHINGMPPSFTAQSHDFSTPLNIEFALQNLNFSGTNNGCDRIDLTLRFLKNGKPTRQEVKFHRSYVALRDAVEKQYDQLDGQLSWQGKYIRAPKEYDTEVFISSILIARNLELQANKGAINQAQNTISQMKSEFDSLELNFEGKKLVAIIRPPLTQISYGLAIGVVEETEQIRFTFPKTTATRLKAFLLEQRKNGGKYGRIIAPDTFLYTIRGSSSYMHSPPICWDDSIS